MKWRSTAELNIALIYTFQQLPVDNVKGQMSTKYYNITI